MAGKRFTIETVFKIIDKVTAPIRRATRVVKRFSTTIKRDFRAAQVQVAMFATTLKTTLVSALRLVAATSVLALGAGLAYAAREFVLFENSIVKAGAQFKDLDPTAKGFEETIKKLGKTARKVGAATEFTATQAGEGLTFLAKAGFSSAQAMALLPKTVDLATATSMDLARATDIASDTLGAFNLNVEDTIQLGKNLAKVNDVLVKTATSSNTSLELLFEAIKKGGPAFAGAGQSMETFSAAVGVLASSGIKGGEAGTVLRNTMLRLANPTKEAAGILEELDVKVADGSGNFRDMFDILDDLQKGMKKYGSVQRTTALDIIFGNRSVTGMNVIFTALGKKTKDGTDKLRAFRESLLKAGGVTERVAAMMRKSLLNRLKILSSSLIEVGLKFVDVFAAKGVSALTSLTLAVQDFDPTSIAEGIMSFIDAVGDMIDFLEPVVPVLLGMAAAWYIYKISLLKAAAAQWIMNAALIANPVGLVIIGIGALIAGIILLVEHWDVVAEAFGDAWDFIMEQLDRPIVALLGALFLPFIAIPMLIIKHWDVIAPFFVDLWDTIITWLSETWDWFLKLLDNPFFATIAFLLTPMLTIPALIQKNWDKIIGLFDPLTGGAGVLEERFNTLLENPWVKSTLTVLNPLIQIPLTIAKNWGEVEKVIDSVGGVLSTVGSALGKAGKFMIGRQWVDEDDDEDDEEDEEENIRRAVKQVMGKKETLATQSYMQKYVSEITRKSEVTIKAPAGVAEQTGPRIEGVRLVQSGAL